MSRLVRILTIVSIAAALSALFAASASAADSRVTYPAQLRVTGGLTITTTHDFTAPCEPGQAWTIAASAEIDVRGKVEVEAVGEKVVQSTETKTPGGAANKNVLSSYSETNYCPPDDPVEIDGKPRCSSHTGAGLAQLVPDKRKKGPLRVAVGINRKGGGEQDVSCEGGAVRKPTPGGSLSALGSTYGVITLPLNITSSQLANLKVGKKLTRQVEIAGSCAAGVIAATSIYRDDKCEVEGAFSFELKRLPGAGRGGFTTD